MKPSPRSTGSTKGPGASDDDRSKPARNPADERAGGTPLIAARLQSWGRGPGSATRERNRSTDHRYCCCHSQPVFDGAGARVERFRLLGLLAFFALALPTFMPSCRLSGVLSAPRRASSRRRAVLFRQRTHRWPCRSSEYPMDEPKAAPAPSYWDHHQLNFWLWACLHDAEAYLKADHDFLTSLRSGPGPTATYAQHQAWRARSDEIRRLIDLEKYHFVATMGSLLRILRRSRELFPAIQTTIDNAQHLMKEGKNLRDMIEHADQYREGKGRKQSEFLREAAGIAEEHSRRSTRYCGRNWRDC